MQYPKINVDLFTRCSYYELLTFHCISGIVATVAAFLFLVCWGACAATICANADYFTSLQESIKDAFHP